MKKIVLFGFVLTFMVACNPTSKSNVFDSDQLRGKYKVDLTPVIAEVSESDSDDDNWDKFGKGLAAMAMSSVKMEITFYENNKGVLHMDGGLIDFASAFGEKPLNKTHSFEYKIENDSVLYMKEEGKEYKKWAIVKKYSESYDYLKLLVIKDGVEDVYFNMNKVTE